MNKCEVSKLLAYSMAIYTVASLYYMICSRSVGTPFKDSLTKEQLLIKEESKKVRKKIFCEGFLVGVIGLYIMKPFKSC
tara:strand:- start:13 stop:249 length:237 start_codon:yes stop_codon:yes gene_type:complete